MQQNVAGRMALLDIMTFQTPFGTNPCKGIGLRDSCTISLQDPNVTLTALERLAAPPRSETTWPRVCHCRLTASSSRLPPLLSSTWQNLQPHNVFSEVSHMLAKCVKCVQNFH